MKLLIMQSSQASLLGMKLVRQIKMHLNEIYGKVYIGKYLSDAFPTQNGLKQDVLLPLPRNKCRENKVYVDILSPECMTKS
jgi:hypothetical protein